MGRPSGTRPGSGSARRGGWTGSPSGTWYSTSRTPRSTSGSSAASSTPPTTAWTVTSSPAGEIIWRCAGPAEAEERAFTYAELLAEVGKLANALKDLGVGKGDVVGVFLPMIPEVAIAMLACARIGAVHNVLFGGFSPHSMIERMQVSGAKVLLITDGARRKGKTSPVKPAVDDMLADAPTVEKVVVVQATSAECGRGATSGTTT